MCHIPRIENRKIDIRYCKCGENHNAEIIQGMLHYSENNYVAYKAALMEHHGRYHAWIGFITGGWDGVEAEDCCILIELFIEDGNIRMYIAPKDQNPFYDNEIFGSYLLTRDEVLVHEGAKNWVIKVYQILLDTDLYISRFINGEV